MVLRTATKDENVPRPRTTPNYVSNHSIADFLHFHVSVRSAARLNDNHHQSNVRIARHLDTTRNQSVATGKMA